MHNKISLAHGAGGQQMHNLIEKKILKILGKPDKKLKDAEIITRIKDYDIAFTTDSYVVNPIFFNGGDIGKLAVAGTVNDLIVTGAKPVSLSLGLILEEGLDIEILEKILTSIRETADLAEVNIITGDTKVVEKKSADKIFINTSGIGYFKWGYRQDFGNVKIGDKIIINGFIGDHGTSVMIARGEFEIQAEIKSDVFPLNNLIESILDKGFNVRFIRDCTRGGVASTLNELARGTDSCMKIYGENIPVRNEVKSFCDILGLDPLYMANEGKAIFIVPPEEADELVEFMKNFNEAADSVVIGEIAENPSGKVILDTGIGSTRIIEMISGEQLPRIC